MRQRVPDLPLVDEALELVFERPALTRPERWRRTAGALVADGFFELTSRACRLVPISHPAMHGVEVVRHLPYRTSGLVEHRLDVYRPQRAEGPLPVVLYVHGGGFRVLSKDSHWIFALMFARRGYLVVSINYRLAPRHPFPAAVEDACAALAWTRRNAAAFGGDPDRIVLAGESAGANLVTSLAVATSWRRQEPWAAELFDEGVAPRAVMPACGYLQVTDPERLWRARRLPSVVVDRLTEVTDAYLGGVRYRHPRELELADPLLVLERGERPERPLPPFFAPCGSLDPLIDDTQRLEAALARLGVECEAPCFDGEPHAFHAFVFRSQAIACWRQTFRFLDRVVGA